MPITLQNSTIAGLGVGGIPSGTVTAASIVDGSVSRPKIGYNGAWLQVVQAVKTDRFGSSVTDGWIAIPGLSLSITPTSSSSTILLMYHINYDSDRSNSGGGFAIWRNGAVLDSGRGAANGNNYRVNGDYGANNNADQSGMHRAGHFTDSPGTTSAITYQLYAYAIGSLNVYVNRARFDDGGGGQADDGVFSSSITAVELSGGY